MAVRATRSNGRASRRQILDAATQLAAERGYEGTSISAVSTRSGLPASSIYWHFANKDDLFVALIDDSYERWLDELGEIDERDERAIERMVASLAARPVFVRLGLMTTLEEPASGRRAGRERFLQIRDDSLGRFERIFAHRYPELGTDQRRDLASMTLALIDGAFVAAVAGEPRLLNERLADAIGLLAASLAEDVAHPT